MNDKITAFVLNQSDYKEADVLMQVASEEYGIISLVGKAGKKLSSKNHFLPMCLYEFIIDYKEGKDIFSIHGYKLAVITGGRSESLIHRALMCGVPKEDVYLNSRNKVRDLLAWCDKYGLKPEERRIFEAGSREIGDVYHDSLMKITSELTEHGLWATVTDEQLSEMMMYTSVADTQSFRRSVIHML